MIIQECENKIQISGILDFDLTKTFECGQCFRWNAESADIYVGVAFGRAVRIYKENNDIYITCSRTEFEDIWKGYFDLARDYAKIRKQLDVSDFMNKAIQYGDGIRLLRQEPWEALCSFIISQNNHIPRIKEIIRLLCTAFGDKIMFDGNTYYSFPCAKTLARLREDDLAPIKSGYRAKYLIAAAQAVSGGVLDFETLSGLSQNEARQVLLKLPGVGNKVADCVLLFGLHMIDAFPVDVWIKRALSKYFDPSFDFTVFSPYGGIAQQYLFYYARNNI
ncbi:MAG: DNA-3-methyladenine glycosylase 2 family protein [Oscillospiraceae bacterium]|nr:DNA-3-methyladenine glycosylase 2 family protein [Oscillospiraceae bacterium]